MIKRALISVSDKTGIFEFAKFLTIWGMRLYQQEVHLST